MAQLEELNFMNHMNKIILKLLILFVAVVIVVTITVAVKFFIDKSNDPFEFHDVACYGFIRDYIEPDELDDMYVYVVLDDRTFVTELSIYAIPKETYDSFDEELKRIIDNREVGYLIDGIGAYNELEFNRMGYSYIKSIRSYDNSVEGGRDAQERYYYIW